MNDIDLAIPFDMILLKDKHWLINKKRQIIKRIKENKSVDSLLEDWQKRLALSMACVRERKAQALTIRYPEELPISEHIAKIKDTLVHHQVLILGGGDGLWQIHPTAKNLFGNGLRHQGANSTYTTEADCCK